MGAVRYADALRHSHACRASGGAPALARDRHRAGDESAPKRGGRDEQIARSTYGFPRGGSRCARRPDRARRAASIRFGLCAEGADARSPLRDGRLAGSRQERDGQRRAADGGTAAAAERDGERDARNVRSAARYALLPHALLRRAPACGTAGGGTARSRARAPARARARARQGRGDERI